MLLLHSRFVATILAGRSVCWNPQRRNASDLRLGDAWRAHRATLLSGAALTLALALVAPSALIWLLPIVAGLLAVVPITVLTSRTRLGAFCRRLGLLLIPEEVAPPEILQKVARERRGRSALGANELYRRLIEDPRFNAAHCALHGDTGPAAKTELWHLMTSGAGAMAADEKMRALSDLDGLRRLHGFYWALQADLSLEPVAGASAGDVDPDRAVIPGSNALAEDWRLNG
jgi:membrane glycosyltransferase